MQGITIPFVPNFLEEGNDALADLSRGMNSFEERSNLLHFHGRCVHHAKMNPSLLLRAHIVGSLQGQGEDIHVGIHKPCFLLSFSRRPSALVKA